MVMDRNSAWAKVAGDEAEAVVGLLEDKGRKVMVLVVAVGSDEVVVIRRVSEGTTSRDAGGIVKGVEYELERLRDKIASAS